MSPELIDLLECSGQGLFSIPGLRGSFRGGQKHPLWLSGYDQCRIVWARVLLLGLLDCSLYLLLFPFYSFFYLSRLWLCIRCFHGCCTLIDTCYALFFLFVDDDCLSCYFLITSSTTQGNIPLTLCATFFRALRTATMGAMGCGRRTQRSLPSVYLFSAGWTHRSDPLGCKFRGFLLIGDPFRFRWAQALTVNYPGLLTLRHIWISKEEANTIAKW
jgi:hypothetical protein